MTDEMRENDAFISRAAAGLRAAPQADAGFVERVMASVEQQQQQPARAWWLRPRMVRVSPIGMLALAAGLVIAAVGTTRIVSRPDSSRVATPATAQDTVYLLRFVLTDDDARSVALVGSFNNWSKGATPMTESAPGVWTVTIPLEPGRHEYAFILNDARGERWAADPAASLRRDEFGTESSIVSVGES